MGWWILAVWIGAVVLAAVVLGFCAYEVLWKSRRLQKDLDRLNGLSATLTELRAEVTAAQQRTTAARG